MKAEALIQEGETAVVVFTKGKHFFVDKDGRGFTGHWAMDPTRGFDRVVVYHRNSATGRNEVYVAVPTGLRASSREGRYVIEFKEARHVGTTEANWYAFADGGPNPVRYVSAG